MERSGSIKAKVLRSRTFRFIVHDKRFVYIDVKKGQRWRVVEKTVDTVYLTRKDTMIVIDIFEYNNCFEEV